MCWILVGIIVFLLILLFRKQLLFVVERIKLKFFNSRIIKWILNVFQSLIYKLIEFFWISVLGVLLLIPIYFYYIGKNILDITYNEYKELLSIVLNSHYVIVFAIIIIVYIFRKEIKKKISQLSEVGSNGVIFLRDTQANQDFSEHDVYDNNVINSSEITRANNEINYDAIRGELLGNNTNEDSLEIENEKLRQHIESLNDKIKIKEFIEIRRNIAKTTNIVLIYMYGKYKTKNFFEKLEIEDVLREITDVKISNIRIEAMVIYQFLMTNKIIDCERENEFSITEYGKEFLEFLFKGGV